MTYQHIVIVGNVGKDPEIRYTQSGKAVCDFSLAVSERYSTANGEQGERTTWWRVTCWDRLAENVSKYVKKGKQVLVTAKRVEARAYVDKSGEARASLDVTADDVRFLAGGGAGRGSSGDEDYSGGGDYGGDDVAEGGYRGDFSAGGGTREERPPRGGRRGAGGNNGEDSIPF